MLKVITILALIGFLGYGWIHNIFLLVHMDCGFCGKEIIRVVGIFMAPLGIVMGFIS